MTIELHRAVDDGLLADDRAIEAVRAALAHGEREGLRVTVVLVDDPTLAELHERFLDDPTPTDVMAFDLGADDDEGPEAEIYASVDRARDVAAGRGVSPERELALYLVHGALHLCGYDDHEPAQRAAMRDAERVVLRALGFPDDAQPHEIDA